MRFRSSVFLVWLLLATPVVFAQSAGIDTTTTTADTTGWRLAPRIRGMHAVWMTAANSQTRGVSADGDILRNSGSRPPLSLGVRIGFEDAASQGLDDYYFDFTTIDLLARLSIGGRSAEMSLYGGYAWIRSYEAGEGTFTETRGIHPKIGVEIRWMFVPKYAGLVVRASTAGSPLLTWGEAHSEPEDLAVSSGGIGFILGWEP